MHESSIVIAKDMDHSFILTLVPVIHDDLVLLEKSAARVVMKAC